MIEPTAHSQDPKLQWQTFKFSLTDLAPVVKDHCYKILAEHRNQIHFTQLITSRDEVSDEIRRRLPRFKFDLPNEVRLPETLEAFGLASEFCVHDLLPWLENQLSSGERVPLAGTDYNRKWCLRERVSMRSVNRGEIQSTMSPDYISEVARVEVTLHQPLQFVLSASGPLWDETRLAAADLVSFLERVAAVTVVTRSRFPQLDANTIVGIACKASTCDEYFRPKLLEALDMVAPLYQNRRITEVQLAKLISRMIMSERPTELVERSFTRMTKPQTPSGYLPTTHVRIELPSPEEQRSARIGQLLDVMRELQPHDQRDIDRSNAKLIYKLWSGRVDDWRSIITRLSQGLTPTELIAQMRLENRPDKPKGNPTQLPVENRASPQSLTSAPKARLYTAAFCPEHELDIREEIQALSNTLQEYVQSAMEKMEYGLFGDSKLLGLKSKLETSQQARINIFETRLKTKEGALRVYFRKDPAKEVVIILAVGTKDDQSSDIERARQRALRYISLREGWTPRAMA